MATEEDRPIEFELSPEHQQAIRALAGSRPARLSGRVVEGRLRVDFVAFDVLFIAVQAVETNV